MERLVLTTGGTGGHIFPALAVAEEIRARHPAARLLFVGSSHGLEAGLTARAGVDFVGLPVRGFLGRGLKAVAAAGRMAWAVAQAVGLVRRFRPQVVAGFGGYASFAPMLAGYACGVPLLLHEQNAVAGLSNRCMGRLARVVCLSLEDTRGFAPEKCVLTGNPVRAAVLPLARLERDFQGRHLLVVGGSQGARALTDAVVEALPRLKAAGVALRLQTGRQDVERARAAVVAAGYAPEDVCAFIEDMPAAYAWADVALCRAGASTVAELAVAGLPSVLVPFPHATHDHQTRNAEILAAHGAALCIAERDWHGHDTTEDGMAQVLALLGDSARLRAMSAAARAQALPQAAAAVADSIEALATRAGR